MLSRWLLAGLGRRLLLRVGWRWKILLIVHLKMVATTRLIILTRFLNIMAFSLSSFNYSL